MLAARLSSLRNLQPAIQRPSAHLFTRGLGHITAAVWLVARAFSSTVHFVRMFCVTRNDAASLPSCAMEHASAVLPRRFHTVFAAKVITPNSSTHVMKARYANKVTTQSCRILTVWNCELWKQPRRAKNNTGSEKSSSIHNHGPDSPHPDPFLSTATCWAEKAHFLWQLRLRILGRL